MQWGTEAKCGLSSDQHWPLSVAAPLSRVTVTLITQPARLLWGFSESVQRKGFKQCLALKQYVNNNTYQQHLKNITEIMSNERRQKQRISYSVILFISNSRISKLTYGTTMKLGGRVGQGRGIGIVPGNLITRVIISPYTLAKIHPPVCLKSVCPFYVNYNSTKRILNPHLHRAVLDHTPLLLRSLPAFHAPHRFRRPLVAPVSPRWTKTP